MDQTCNPREAFPQDSVEAIDMYQDDEDTTTSTREAFSKSRSGSFSSSIPESSASSQLASSTSPLPDKKQPKKRKAWGQVLPTPTTNLPPRKRAKTEAEREQRRVERIMRNRNAAQTSREKKREAYEKLENEKKAAEERAERLSRELQRIEGEKDALQNHVTMLFDQIRAMEVGKNANGSSSHIAAPSSSPTLSPDLLLGYSRGTQVSSRPESPIQETIDPRASFSPSSTMTVVAPATTPNLTQRPAEPLCVLSNDQQCQLGVAGAVSEQHRPHLSMMDLLRMYAYTILSAMTWSISLGLMHPLYQIFVSPKTGRPLQPEMGLHPNLSLLINFLTSMPSNLGVESLPRTANLTTLLTYSARPFLQINSLQRFLACNPILAPHTRVATVKALQRLSSSGDLKWSQANSTEVRTNVASLVRLLRKNQIKVQSEMTGRLDDDVTGGNRKSKISSRTRRKRSRRAMLTKKGFLA